jgi:hypothetical protein
MYWLADLFARLWTGAQQAITATINSPAWQLWICCGQAGDNECAIEDRFAQRVGWAAEGKGKSLLRKGPKWLPILISG